MPFIDEIAAAAQKTSTVQAGAFYGPAAGLSAGAGLIYEGINYPVFNPAENRFQIRTGLALVLSHECDIDPQNSRDVNTEVLIAPIITVPAFSEIFDTSDGRRALGSGLASNIAAGHVTRMQYLPQHVAPIQHGCFLHFNAITSTHISQLSIQDARSICALSEYGMGVVDRHLQSHLFKPKTELLAALR
jgi:hypothetical protein